MIKMETTTLGVSVCVCVCAHVLIVEMEIVERREGEEEIPVH